MTPQDWDRVVQVNLSGAFYLSRAILQHMLDRGSGRIINISSIIGESGNIGQANYAAAKAGLFGLTMSLAQETARKGITVNSVAPGYISTEMVAAVPKEALDKVIAKIPVGRLGEPDEIARVVEFLADPDSGFITGQIYSVNGGQYMWGPPNPNLMKPGYRCDQGACNGVGAQQQQDAVESHWRVAPSRHGRAAAHIPTAQGADGDYRSGSGVAAR